MSKIIDPRTGQSIGAQQQMAQMGQMIMAIQQLAAKVDALTAQQMHMGLFLEFFVEKTMAVCGEDGEPLLPVDMNEFPAWADKRTAEIRAEAEAEMAARQKAAEAALAANEDVAPAEEINLDDGE